MGQGFDDDFYIRKMRRRNKKKEETEKRDEARDKVKARKSGKSKSESNSENTDYLEAKKKELKDLGVLDELKRLGIELEM